MDAQLFHRPCSAYYMGSINDQHIWITRPRGRPKKTWKEVVREDCQARKLNKEDATDRCKWRKVLKEAR